MKTNKNITFFLHIPKTAGTTINNILAKNYGKANIIELNKPYKHRELLKKKWTQNSKTKLVRGHFPFGVHDCLDITPRYITVLRHPYERMFSFYKYILSNPTHYHHKTLRNSAQSFAEFLADPDSPEVDNQQVRLLSGSFSKPNETNEQTYQVALDNFNKYFCLIGLQEFFDETLILMKILLPLSSIKYYSKNVNKSKQPYTPTTEEKALLDKTNHYDIALYKHAQSLFFEIIEKNRTEFDKEMLLLEKAKQSKLLMLQSKILESVDTPYRRLSNYLKRK